MFGTIHENKVYKPSLLIGMVLGLEEDILQINIRFLLAIA